MTVEDLQQIRQIVREEIAARIDPAVESLRGEFKEQLNSGVESLRGEFKERLDAAMVSVAADFSDLRAEMNRRFEDMQRTVRALESRVDTLSNVMLSMDARLTGLTRTVDRIERDYSDVQARQAAQQRAIDDLVKRWTKGPQQ